MLLNFPFFILFPFFPKPVKLFYCFNCNVMETKIETQRLSAVKDIEIQKITPFLWFDTQAMDAANFYASVFKNARVKTPYKV